MLKRIERIVEQAQMLCDLQQATDELPIERLLVFLGHDAQNRERVLEITAQKLEFNQSLQQNSFQFHRIQFNYCFPFKVVETAHVQVASLLLFLNHTLD